MKTLKWTSLIMLLMTTLIISCAPAKTEEEKAADKINEGVDKLTEGLGDAAKSVEGGLAGALSQLEDAVENISEEGINKKQPVNFRKLKELLPESSDGLSRSKFSGESNGIAGFKISTAKAKYEDGDKRIDVELMDTGGVGMAMMGLAAWSMVDIDKESDDGFERTTTYKGNKAFEKCNKSRCEFSVFAGNRFLLMLKGRNVKMDDLHDLAEEIGIKKLESMKDEEG